MPRTNPHIDYTDKEDRLTAKEEAAARALYNRIKRVEEHIRAHRADQGEQAPDDWLWANAWQNLAATSLTLTSFEDWTIRSILRQPPALPPGF